MCQQPIARRSGCRGGGPNEDRKRELSACVSITSRGSKYDRKYELLHEGAHTSASTSFWHVSASHIARAACARPTTAVPRQHERKRVPQVRAGGMCQDHTARGPHKHEQIRAAGMVSVIRHKTANTLSASVSAIQREASMGAKAYRKYELLARVRNMCWHVSASYSARAGSYGTREQVRCWRKSHTARGPHQRAHAPQVRAVGMCQQHTARGASTLLACVRIIHRAGCIRANKYHKYELIAWSVSYDTRSKYAEAPASHIARPP